MNKILAFLFFLFVAFIFSPGVFSQVHAIQIRSDKDVFISAEAVNDQSIAVSGESIRIDGNIQGDVFCAGKDITVTGSVSGDIICAGQTIQLNGNVGGDVRVAGQNITIAGVVQGNATVFAQSVAIDSTGGIQGELLTATERLDQKGYVGQDISGWVKDVHIGGVVGRNVTLTVESLTVSPSASIAGTISYHSNTKANVDPEASVSGIVEQKKLPQESNERQNRNHPLSNRWNGGLYGLITLLLGGFIVLIAKRRIQTFLADRNPSWLLFFLFGVAMILFVPISLLLFAVTIIGIPVAILGSVLFVLAYFLGRTLVAFMIGRYIVLRFMTHNKDSAGWWLVIGVVVTWIIFSIPVLGSVGSLLASIYGLGAVLPFLFQKKS